MNREQAKIRCKLSKKEWEALGESGIAKWYEVMEHFANGGDVEYKYTPTGVWSVVASPTFKYASNYRIKSKTRIVNGFEVPAPIEKYTGQVPVYVPSFTADYLVESFYATRKLIERRAAFETKEAARANTLAMLGIDPSTYEEQEE